MNPSFFKRFFFFAMLCNVVFWAAVLVIIYLVLSHFGVV